MRRHNKTAAGIYNVPTPDPMFDVNIYGNEDGEDGADESSSSSLSHDLTKQSPPMSMAVLILIIVGSLTLVVGAIYMLIYFKSIKPMSARSRSYVEQGGKSADDGAHKTKSAHPFFRRK